MRPQTVVSTTVIWTLGCGHFCAYSPLVLSFISQWHEQYVHVMIDNPQALLVYVHAQM
jgi:hypothetical protein